MRKKLQLTIAEPCHENWENMSPADKGKFCGSCQKQVVDFSDMSDRQVAEFFKKPTTGSVCGRFMTDQLDRDIEIPKKRIPWVKYFFQFALPAFLLSIKASAQKTQGKIKVNTVSADTTRRTVFAEQNRTLGMVARPDNFKPFMGDTIVVPVEKPITTIKGEIDPVCSEELIGKVSPLALPTKSDTLRIRGKVIDENGNPIPYASIIIKGTKIGVAANLNGEFSIRPVSDWEEVVLVSSCAGCNTTEVVVDRGKYSENIVITVEPVKNYEMMGALVVTRCYPTKTAKPVPLMSDIPKETVPKSFHVFPNPVSSGGNLTIDWKQTEEGYFILQLLNLSGQSAHQQEIWIDAEARLLNIDVPPIVAGSYFLVLTNRKSGKKLTEKIIIQ